MRSRSHVPSRLLTDAFREIRHTMSRFLSLFLLSALAVAFLAGLRSTAPDMEYTADAYYDRTHLMDVRVLSTLGLTDEDIEALAGQPGVAAAEGAWYVDATVHAQENDYIVRLHSLSEAGINDPELVEGRLPEADDECVVEPELLTQTGLSIGDTLVLDTADTDYEESLHRESFTIVGTVHSSLYVSMDRGTSTVGTGRLSAIAFLPRSAFAQEVYTEAYLLAEGTAELLCYGEDYEDRIDTLVDVLEPLGEERAQARYDQVVGEAQEALDEARQEYEDGKAEAEAELSDARQQLDDARKELDDGWAEYYDGQETLEQEYADGLEKLEQGEADLSAALAELQDGETEYQDGLTALEESRSQYESGLAAYQAGLAQYEEGRDALLAAEEEYKRQEAALQAAQAQYEQALAAAGGEGSMSPELAAMAAQIEAGKAQLAAGREELDQSWAQLEASLAPLEAAKAQLDDAQAQIQAGEEQLSAVRSQLDNGWTEYERGMEQAQEGREQLERETEKARQQLSDALSELENGEAEYQDGLREYQDGKAEADAELSDAEEKLSDAQAEIDKIQACEWYILDRNTNTGYVSYQQDAQRMGNLANLFPVIFFLVAALVCLTTMTRMVEENRVEIGGFKALGYGRAAIAFKYVGYGLLSSLAGGLVGLAVGCTIIPTIIFNAWKVLYTMGELQIFFFPGIYAMAVGAAVLCVAGTALLTSFATLTAVPAALMRPRAPQAGKRVLLERITPLWKRLSFTHKVTVRNLFRYKKRLLMTVIGIGGCTALLIAGFGLRDSLHAIFTLQYDELTTYDAQVSLTDDATAEDLSAIGEALDSMELVEDWSLTSTVTISVESEARSMDSYTYLFAVTDPDSFSSFVTLRDRSTGQSVSLPDDGAVITEKLARLLDVEVGDTVTIVDADNTRTDVTVAGITENYIMHYVYLSHEAYTAIYGQEPPVNSIMLHYTEDTEDTEDVADTVSAALIPLSGVSSVSRTTTLRDQVSRGLEGVDYAVVVIVFAAAALAFVVLYNLTNINITERLRELATLKVLGFQDKELFAYVYRESIVLTILGILLGLVLGKLLHLWLVQTVEIDMAMFGRDIEPVSYLFSVALTAVFSILVSLAARRRLRKIDMVESLKTVE